MAYKKPLPRTEQEKRAFQHWLTHPCDAVKDWFGATPDDWQGKILTDMFPPDPSKPSPDGDRVAMKAAHGPGKTTIDAWVGHIFLNCYPDCRVVATAPTMSQLRDVLFPEMAKWHNKMPGRMKDEWTISGDHIRHKTNPNDWFAVARTSNQPANLQGFHGTNLLIMADEASAIDKAVFEVIEGALSEAGEDGKVAKLLMGGNPNFNAGELYDAFNKHRDMYSRVTITGDVDFLKKLEIQQGDYHADHGKVYYSPRVKQKYVNNIIKKYGKDSAVYDVRVRGIFPRVGDMVVVPLEWAERCSLLFPPHFDPVADHFDVICDPSRGGSAETAIGVSRKGVLIYLEAHGGMTSGPQVANRVHEVVETWKAKGLKHARTIVDLPGVGGAVVDFLRRDFGYEVTAYDGGKPLVKGVDPEEDCKMFANRRARDWWNVRRKLELGMPIPADETLVAQLASVKYDYNGSERILVESKADLKGRLGEDASPDRADVLVMACHPTYAEGVAPADIDLGDFDVGQDRDTTQYREEMDLGLV